MLVNEGLWVPKRLRRGRRTAAVRDLLQETWVGPQDLVAPLFVIEGTGEEQAIGSLPGVSRWSIDRACDEAEELWGMGVRGIALFPVLEREKKDPEGSEAVKENNLAARACRAIKERVPGMVIIIDVALDPYTSHGHDGLVDEKGKILNDETVSVLCEMSLRLAEAGADYVAPSDMMDGRVRAIREALDREGHVEVGILSYAAKYASALYGPFREALQVKLAFGDKKTYQMNPANKREAVLEARLDEEEGADILMVKPALAYLDVIQTLRERSELPIAAYHVSGEYSMVMAAHERGWLNGPQVMEEHLMAIKRAGADMIFTYAAKMMCKKWGR